MSRGWESKSVEEQQAMSNGEKPESVADVVRDPRMEANRKRERQALELQRERVLSERTSSPHRRTALESALVSLEEKLAELGWSVHM